MVDNFSLSFKIHHVWMIFPMKIMSFFIFYLYINCKIKYVLLELIIQDGIEFSSCACVVRKFNQLENACLCMNFHALGGLSPTRIIQLLAFKKISLNDLYFKINFYHIINRLI